jgi:serine/threonine protein phosphatase PrpC
MNFVCSPFFIINKMYIKSILKRGNSHALACQDSIYQHETEEYLFAAVFDGCSEIEDSHFASNLLKKTFKNEIEKQLVLEKNRMQLYDNFDIENQKEIENVATEVMASFFKKLDLIRIELNLTANDFASTCLFLFYDKLSETGIIYVFGDGFLSINGIDIITI